MIPLPFYRYDRNFRTPDRSGSCSGLGSMSMSVSRSVSGSMSGFGPMAGSKSRSKMGVVSFSGSWLAWVRRTPGAWRIGSRSGWGPDGPPMTPLDYLL